MGPGFRRLLARDCAGIWSVCRRGGRHRQAGSLEIELRTMHNPLNPAAPGNVATGALCRAGRHSRAVPEQQG